ncbi:hypothetical protein EHS25_002264 [Saitozyma podzolica]|uniref:Alpha-galactosidase n=1 Tax=Saitozyma podzolica TaxID=1890683 RepID=A0A427YDK9_9TREE|nr:hypothetical protein EHS25_002264 [Saitozyma podzolica]
MTIALPSSCLSVVNNANGTALPDKPGVAKANGTSRHVRGIAIHEDLRFTLSSTLAEYRLHVDESGDLIHDHFGPPVGDLPPKSDIIVRAGWGTEFSTRTREFPDSGRGDFRLPAFHLRHSDGSTVTHLKYRGHHAMDGKPPIPGLPSTFGNPSEVSTLVMRLEDDITQIGADLRYSVFHNFGAIVRSFVITNHGTETIAVERAASFSLDVPSENWELLQLSGDWGRENKRVRRPITLGSQGFHNSTGFTSHYHNPFFGLVDASTTENAGRALGFSLVYSGSYAVDVEKTSFGRTRAQIGLNPLHLSLSLAPGESFHSPECVGVYSNSGLGGMSRTYHRLYRNHLSMSHHTHRARPPLINSWEAFYTDFDSKRLLNLAGLSSQLGFKLMVLDDGWFGNKYPRTDVTAGLGDWIPTSERFPEGWDEFIRRVRSLQVGSSDSKLKFGLWVEPEMVNPHSELFDKHPDWVLSAGRHERSVKRDQLVLNLGLAPVQEYILEFMSDLLASGDIEYIKWDCNRCIHEAPSPSDSHGYVLGLYRIAETLNSRFPEVLFEGCASGGGRFDPGLLHYWPQTWTSDNTDALDRLSIQFGTTLVYPASAMGCHVSACPNEQSGRVTPFEFRAHVAMMGGSFGFELDPAKLEERERQQIPKWLALSEKVSKVTLEADLYRLADPEESNYPAALYMSHDGSLGVLFAFCLRAVKRMDCGPLRLQGLDPQATYDVDEERWTGAALMEAGLSLCWACKAFQSRLFAVVAIQ